MSWDHQTLGWDRYEDLLKLLTKLDIHHIELYRKWKYSPKLHRGRDIDFGEAAPAPLRLAAFIHPTTGRHWLIEEYVATRDWDCDGTSWIAVEVYPVGLRPDIESRTQYLAA
ncbi:MAG TPA: hypothetical protein VJJ72_01470 [Candidatus Paceibacterota bacterium]